MGQVPESYWDDDCACAKAGRYEPACPHCEPQDDDEAYTKAFYDQEMKGR